VVELLVKKLKGNDDLPDIKYMTGHAAGVDLYAAVQEETIITPGEIKLIPTGISLAIPDGYEAQVRPRSGLALKKGISIVNAPGTIDADYRGEVGVILINMGKEAFLVNRADRIAQMVISPYLKADIKFVTDLSETERGARGFGSTGVSHTVK